jgi:uncharacterized protein (TIGR03437 family)
MLRFCLALCAGLAGSSALTTGFHNVTPQPATQILIFSKTTGFRHDSIPHGIGAIRQLGQQNNFAVGQTEDAAAFNDANLAQFKAVIFLCTTGDLLNEAQQAAFERFIRAGNGYVGIHSASDTEYDWPWYGGLVGAYFRSHPNIQRARIKIEDAAHPSTQGLPAVWERTDEWYDFRLNPRGRVRVLATVDENSYQSGTMGADHPIAWCQLYDGGRAWYTAGGHTSESYSEALFLQHLLGGIQFAAGLKEAEASALAGVSAASFRREAVARESIATIFGADLASEQQSASSLPLSTTLAGTSVLVKDQAGTERLAPLFFVAPGQINFLVPPGATNGAASLTVVKSDGTRPSTVLPITSLAPGLFAANGNGQGIAAGVALRVRPNIRAFVPLARYDESLGRYVAVPLEFLAPDEELYLVLFGTGWRGRSTSDAITLRLGSVAAPVLFAGGQGELAGVDQINAQLPRSLVGRGVVNIELQVGGQPANVVTIQVQ